MGSTLKNIRRVFSFIPGITARLIVLAGISGCPANRVSLQSLEAGVEHRWGPRDRPDQA